MQVADSEQTKPAQQPTGTQDSPSLPQVCACTDADRDRPGAKPDPNPAASAASNPALTERREATARTSDSKRASSMWWRLQVTAKRSCGQSYGILACPYTPTQSAGLHFLNDSGDEIVSLPDCGSRMAMTCGRRGADPVEPPGLTIPYGCGWHPSCVRAGHWSGDISRVRGDRLDRSGQKRAINGGGRNTGRGRKDADGVRGSPTVAPADRAIRKSRLLPMT